MPFGSVLMLIGLILGVLATALYMFAHTVLPLQGMYSMAGVAVVLMGLGYFLLKMK
jgi:lysozyme family protein